jgi:hypothetical protein
MSLRNVGYTTGATAEGRSGVIVPGPIIGAAACAIGDKMTEGVGWAGALCGSRVDGVFRGLEP